MHSAKINVQNYQGEAEPACLIPQAGSSYREVGGLKEAIRLLENWQYKSALEIVNENINHKVEVIDSLLLKGEIYALFEQNEAARDVYWTILQMDPTNIYALVLIIGQSAILGKNNEETTPYFKVLKSVSFPLYDKLKNILDFIVQHKTNFDFPKTNEPIDLICVFGYFLNKDGSRPAVFKERVRITNELAKKYPQAKIVVSGGPVQNKYCESIEMKKDLLAAGIEEERLVALTKAKDTVGNILEFMEYIRGKSFQNICIVTSAEHLPRAWMSFYMGLKEEGIHANLFVAAPVKEIDGEIVKREIPLSYQTVLRIAGLFEKEAIQKQIF